MNTSYQKSRGSLRRFRPDQETEKQQHITDRAKHLYDQLVSNGAVFKDVMGIQFMYFHEPTDLRHRGSLKTRIPHIAKEPFGTYKEEIFNELLKLIRKHIVKVPDSAIRDCGTPIPDNINSLTAENWRVRIWMLAAITHWKGQQRKEPK